MGTAHFSLPGARCPVSAPPLRAAPNNWASDVHVSVSAGPASRNVSFAKRRSRAVALANSASTRCENSANRIRTSRVAPPGGGRASKRTLLPPLIAAVPRLRTAIASAARSGSTRPLTHRSTSSRPGPEHSSNFNAIFWLTLRNAPTAFQWLYRVWQTASCPARRGFRPWQTIGFADCKASTAGAALLTSGRRHSSLTLALLNIPCRYQNRPDVVGNSGAPRTCVPRGPAYEVLAMAGSTTARRPAGWQRAYV